MSRQNQQRQHRLATGQSGTHPSVKPGSRITVGQHCLSKLTPFCGSSRIPVYDWPAMAPRDRRQPIVGVVRDSLSRASQQELVGLVIAVCRIEDPIAELRICITADGAKLGLTVDDLAIDLAGKLAA